MPETDPTYVNPETVRAERHESFPDDHYEQLLTETREELLRAWLKFGQQDRPSFSAPLLTLASEGSCWEPEQRNRFYGVPTEEAAKRACDERFAKGEGTWADIFVEEMAEAFGAARQNEIRMELIQTAAMALAWVATIDRVGLAGADQA